MYTNICSSICNATTKRYFEGKNNENKAATSTGREEGRDAPNDSVTSSNEGGQAKMIQFNQSLIDLHAEKFRFCLVGKFPASRPWLEQIREWAGREWKLQGECSITLLDNHHVFLKLDNELDMIHVLTSSMRYFVNGHPLKVFKWNPLFRPADGEPSIAAIWVSFHSLPVVFFHKELLFPIASRVGKVLAMDTATRDLSRTDVARVCVEVDLLKELPRRIWIGVGEGKGLWQEIEYERLPSYCAVCRQQGHPTALCSLEGDDDLEIVTEASKEKTIAHEKFENAQMVQHKVDCGAVVEPSTSSKKKGKDITLQGNLVVPIAESEVTVQEKTRELLRSSELGERLDQGYERLVDGFELQERNTKGLKRSPRRWRFSFGKAFFTPKRGKAFMDSIPTDIEPLFAKRYRYSDIEKMTNFFKYELGQGSFGSLFKGKLADSRLVAVNILTEYSGSDKQFLNEINIIGMIRHANIVSLLGFCIEGSKAALVYEFMDNGFLDHFLLSKDKKTLGWKNILQIAVGITRGLHYLHSYNIVHCDIKPTNVVLDGDCLARICDFGLSRTFETKMCDHVSHIAGEMRYMAPETFRSNFSSKADVYSFGILLFDMVAGKMGYNSSVSGNDLFNWLYKNSNGRGILLPSGEKALTIEAAAKKLILVSMWCIQIEPTNRPSMSRILEMLEGSVEELTIPASFSSYVPPRFLCDPSPSGTK